VNRLKEFLKIKSMENRFLQKIWLRGVYFKYHRRVLSFRNPKTFTEKMQWAKVYGNLEDLATYVDKYEVRRYVSDTIGEQYLIPSFGVYNNAEDIDFDLLPASFVIKAVHSAGQNLIITNKKKIDYDEIRKKINQWLNSSYYKSTGEKNYKHIIPRVVIEEYIKEETGGLKDYKFYCFKGKPSFIQVISNREHNQTIDYFDLKWNDLNIRSKMYLNSKKAISKPSNLEEMVKVAELLSAKFSFVRVDLYNVRNKIYFGELTFTPANGLRPYESLKHDIWIGSFIEKEDLRSFILK
jgi:hypothetical protein